MIVQDSVYLMNYVAQTWGMEISKSHYLFGDLRVWIKGLENLFSEVEVVCFV